MTTAAPQTTPDSTPRRIEIFAAGTHTAANGQTRAWSAAELEAIAEGYDPATFMAPIVVGHPKTNDPAFGWITGLAVEDGKLVGTVEQVNADFAAAVKAGAYKKVSASFWPPEAKGNPKPGTFQLRHVGFLGAHAPAVHGLKPVEFADPEADVIAFADLPLTRATMNFGAVEPWSIAAGFDAAARMFRSFREWVLAEKGQEAADRVAPNWEIESLSNAAVRLREADAPAAAPASFAAPAPGKPAAPPTPSPGTEKTSDHGGSDVNAEDIARRDAELKAEREKLDRERVEFAARKAEQLRAADTALVDRLVGEGRILPAEKEGLLAAFAGFGGGTYDFAADGPEAKAKAALAKFLAGLAPRVPLGQAGAPGAEEGIDHAAAGAGEDIGRALAKIRAEAKAAGEGEIDSAEAARRYRRARA